MKIPDSALHTKSHNLSELWGIYFDRIMLGKFIFQTMWKMIVVVIILRDRTEMIG